MSVELRIRSHTLSRRSFLATATGASIVVGFGGWPPAFAQKTATIKPNAWVMIAPDGIITIVSPAVEMGQGVMTGLPVLLAEELDADWFYVRVVQAPANAKEYGNPFLDGMQLTVASLAMRGYYQKLRLIGAQTRSVLLATAAELWAVPRSELETAPNRVLHKPSGREIGYGALSKHVNISGALPAVTSADLKPMARWRYIGKSLPRVDIPAKIDGTAQYGIDVQLPNMLYGAVLRPPVQGEKAARIEDTAAKAIKGVISIVPLPYGVGIVGTTVEAVLQAKDALNVEWTNAGKAQNYTTDEVLRQFRATAGDTMKTGAIVIDEGNTTEAISGAAKVLRIDYLSDHVAHANMEPMNATALVTDEGVEVWAPTQGPTLIQFFGARAAQTSPDRIKVNTTFLGGGLGRRGELDFTIDAILLAKTMKGRPVKVIWSREDDVQNDKFRPMTAQHLRIGLDAKGKIVAWHHRIVGDSIVARILPEKFRKDGKDEHVTEGCELNYHIPAHLVEYIRDDRGVDVGFWRGKGLGYTKFAIECAIDEVATMNGVDPVAFRLDLLDGQPRAQAVIRTVAEMAGWTTVRSGRALGVAYSDALGTHCAEVAEVSLNRATGEIRVHEVWCAVDPGVAVQPDSIVAQMESGIVHGTSQALSEQITFKSGEVQQTNFHDYRVMRMAEAPSVHVRVMATPENRPGGIGEVSLAPMAAAIANAAAKLTDGKRLRHLPMSPSRVLEVLKS